MFLVSKKYQNSQQKLSNFKYNKECSETYIFLGASKLYCVICLNKFIFVYLYKKKRTYLYKTHKHNWSTALVKGKDELF